MISTNWTKTDSTKARQIWKEYQQEHDLSDRIGQTAGIDPQGGRIWFGGSIREFIEKRDADGFSSPLFFERIGSETYFRKGSHH